MQASVGEFLKPRVVKVTPTMPSQAAGKMGATTSQIGDRIATAI